MTLPVSVAVVLQQSPHADGGMNNDSTLSLGKMLTLSLFINVHFNNKYQ